MENKMHWKDFFSGVGIGAACVALIAIFMIPGMIRDAVGGKSTSVAESESSAEEPDLKMYDTTIKDWEVTLSDSSILKYTTPSDWFSLADQYNDGLIQYYGKELSADGIVCVGNDKDQYKATMIINARPLSNVKTVLESIYEDEFNEEEMLYSPTYEFMKDGKEPEDGSTIEELDSVVSADGHTYRFFHHAYDTSYYTNEEQTETETVRTDEIIGYSDTDDTVEIILYMKEYDQSVGLGKLKEFLGASAE